MIEKSLFKPLLLVSVAVWFGFLTLYVSISLIDGIVPRDLVQRIATSTFSATLCFFAGILVFSVISRFPGYRWPLVGFIGLATLLIHAAVGVAVFLAFPPFAFLETAEFLPLFKSGITSDSPIVSSVFVGFVAIHLGRELAEQQRLTLARESAARDAQLAALRHQLSPHFLFNALNSISALISEGDRSEAEHTVLMLSEFLRFSLEEQASELIPLEEELASVHAYLAIEYVRYEDRLSVRETIDEAAKSVLVPPFLLQPIFENIIKHAVSKRSRPVQVSLDCSIEGKKLWVVVQDDGPGIGKSNPSHPGTGIRNLQQRLELLYGRNAELKVTSLSPNGVRIAIWLTARLPADA